jgi:general stress protein YciG
MPKQFKGLSSMDPEKQRKIASKGGKYAYPQGRAYTCDSQEAAEAGLKDRSEGKE